MFLCGAVAQDGDDMVTEEEIIKSMHDIGEDGEAPDGVHQCGHTASRLWGAANSWKRTEYAGPSTLVSSSGWLL